jgi:hypothetical protein
MNTQKNRSGYGVGLYGDSIRIHFANDCVVASMSQDLASIKKIEVDDLQMPISWGHRAQLGRQNFETKQQAVDYLNSLSSMSYEDKVKAIKEFNNMKRILSEV